MIECIMKQQRETYIANLKENIMRMKELLNEFSLNCSTQKIDDFRRYFHTMRGTAQTLHIKGLGIIGTRYDMRLTRMAERDAEEEEYIKVLEEGFSAVKQELDRYDGNQEELDRAAVKGEDSSGAGSVYGSAIPDVPESEPAESILMLDDDQPFLEIVKRALEKDGLNVYITSEYEEAERILMEVPVGLFLVDLYMPGVNGFEALDRIRTQGILTPAVVCSGDGTAMTREKALKAGALDIIVKPINTNEIAALIRYILKRISRY
jgi:CheY-like chemotaxis protein